jgi:hypothetical protein
VQTFCKLPPVFPPVLRYPPVRWTGWDSIDNDIMVGVKGWLATVAVVALLMGAFPITRNWRITSLGARIVIAALLWSAAIAFGLMGYIADFDVGHQAVLKAMSVPDWLVKLSRIRGTSPGWYYSGGTLALCAFAVTAVFVKRGGPRIFDSLLVVIGALSFVSWWNVGHYHFDHYIHIWEHYHYVIGGKYGPELRYSRLYQCTAVADIQDACRR